MPLSSLPCIFSQQNTLLEKTLLSSLLIQKLEPDMSPVFRHFAFWVLLPNLFTVCLTPLMAAGDTNIAPDAAPGNPPPKSHLAPFRPSIAVIVGVLTTMFSLTFLLLLYAKHCKRNGGVRSGYGGNPNSGVAHRRNSGIDRTVIESLPIFRFGSLRGQKNGLECAVCLNRFDETEVLRLLPKCRHAFHVECVDTWLDAHSTCPLCRYRVDPEDVLLVDEPEPDPEPVPVPVPNKPVEQQEPEIRNSEVSCRVARVSGRHSSAGEKSSKTRNDSETSHESSIRRSADIESFRESKWSHKNQGSGSVETVSIGCFDRGGRKDGLLLTEAVVADRESFERRFEHQIIVSDTNFQRRWSDLKPSDLLFLRSEMIITDSGRYSNTGGSRASSSKRRKDEVRMEVREDVDGNGKNVINSRSVSEITGLSRFRNGVSREEGEKALKRWMGWAWAGKLGSRAHPVNSPNPNT